MDVVAVKDVIYLSSSHEIPRDLRGLNGVRWHRAQSPQDLKDFFRNTPQQGETFVVVNTDFLSAKTVETFLVWTQLRARLCFIFIVQSIENAAFQMSLNSSNLLFLYQSEGPRVAQMIHRRILGGVVRSRKQERSQVQAEVMLKKSAIAPQSPTGRGVQFLKEGKMNDFSQGGAQILMAHTKVKAKDFVSLMYRNRHGAWVSVESQVRWVVSNTQGEQIIGVQFLAVSA